MQTHTAQTSKPTPFESDLGPASSAGQDMDDFIYLISHDVRASVRALLELPQWIKEDLEEAGVRVDGAVGSSIDLMNRHTGRLDRMLVDLLSYSRVGRMQTASTIALGPAIEDVIDHMHIPSGFTVTRDLQCAQVVLGDRDLPLMISALVSNAIKHHDKAAGRIHISSRRLGSHVLLRVEDDGPGIETQFHDRVFAPMTTLRPRDEVEGSGMGLANVSRIARHYGGTASIGETRFGRGTSVEITIAQPHQS